MMIDHSGQQIGSYRLIRRLGFGGFASVYLGRHVRISTQQAAIKLLHILDVDTKKFQQEAETTAALVHPHIIRLFDYDFHDQMPFLVMDYAPGGSLRTRHPRGTRVPLATVVQYVQEIAKALEYAHSKHVIHRDIKPDNVLIGAQGELRLSDFGIAVLSGTGRTTLAASYDTGGTAYYMAPEQSRGKPEKASDQYALAIMVYEWLCGKPPFSEGHAINIQYQHAHEPVPPLREQLPTLPPVAEQVIMRALAKDAKGRFATVQEFATALEQASQTKPSIPVPTQPKPVPSEPTPPPVPTMLTPPATPMPIPSEMNTPAVQLLPPTIPARTATPLDTQVRPQSPTSKHPAPNTRPALQACLTRRRVLIGLVVTGVVGSGITWFAHSQQSTPNPANYITPTPTPLFIDTTLYTYRGHSGAVWAVPWSPDGSRIASGSDDHTVQVWDATNGGNVFTYRGHAYAVYAVAWSPDGKRIASGSQDTTVQVWDATDGGNVFTYRGHSSNVHAVAWSPDGGRIASGSEDNTVQVWDAVDGGNVFTYKGHSNDVQAVAWSPDGKRIASADSNDTGVGGDCTVQVWDATDGGNVFTYHGQSDGVYAVAWSPDGKRIASGSAADQTVQVWNATNGGDVFTYQESYGGVAWSPDGKRIASGSEDETGATVQVWDAVNGGNVYIYKEHSDDVQAIAWSPDGKRIASGANDNGSKIVGTVQVWEAS